MPTFENTAPADLKFVIDKRVYSCPQGGAVEIPVEFAYVPKRRGLPLKQVDSTTKPVSFSERKPPPPQRDPPGVQSGDDALKEDDVDSQVQQAARKARQARAPRGE